ncbi:MAG: RNA-directed DNA polymerase, partial [bacterium]|nr:RNA-directed DNA polymerase [bacterium]
KADIRKFFASIDHAVLIKHLQAYIPDLDLMKLLQTIILSFSTAPGKGLPLGNLTSQLFCNVYMNSFDQFVKHELKVPHYVRYADDFVLLSHDRTWLEKQVEPMRNFLREELKLEIHPDKLWIKTLASGADFLGWVHFPYHRVLRRSTKLRAQRAMSMGTLQGASSYIGMLEHGNARKLRDDLLNRYWIEHTE